MPLRPPASPAFPARSAAFSFALLALLPLFVAGPAQAQEGGWQANGQAACRPACDPAKGGWKAGQGAWKGEWKDGGMPACQNAAPCREAVVSLSGRALGIEQDPDVQGKGMYYLGFMDLGPAGGFYQTFATPAGFTLQLRLKQVPARFRVGHNGAEVGFLTIDAAGRARFEGRGAVRLAELALAR